MLDLPTVGGFPGLYFLDGGARLLIRPGLRIRVAPGGFYDVVRACCLGRNLMIHVLPGGLHDLIYAPPGGAGLLFRPEFDDSCASRWLT